MTLYESVYARVRQAVVQKLGDKAGELNAPLVSHIWCRCTTVCLIAGTAAGK
jgi:hypothetical protein